MAFKSKSKKTESTKTRPDIPIIFEDNHLLVVDKPAGLLSQEDNTGDKDLLTLGKQYLKKKYDKPGNVFLGLVHRLDRPVSGVMVLARTSKSASRLSEQIRNHNISKTYWALVYGITPIEGTLTHFLKKDEKTNTVKAYSSKKKGAQEATLSFRTIKQNAHYSLVEIDLITGKPHQIRVQMTKFGFPLWGDYKYGEVGTGPGKILALRSIKLSFLHPTTQEKMEFKSLPPVQKPPWNFFEY